MSNQGPKISTFVRVLAWIFLAIGAIVLVGIAPDVFSGRHLNQGTDETLMLVLGMAVIMPLFGFVAWTGRSPRWMSSMENIVEDEAKRRGMHLSPHSGLRKVAPVSASIVFGLGLIYFGRTLGIFSGETGWFAMTLFALCWLGVTVALWWKAIRRAPRE